MPRGAPAPSPPHLLRVLRGILFDFFSFLPFPKLLRVVLRVSVPSWFFRPPSASALRPFFFFVFSYFRVFVILRCRFSSALRS
jgi:hypothetical protein